jgi:hypothetical protein
MRSARRGPRPASITVSRPCSSPAQSKLAERVVGHELPGKLKQGGNLASYRTRALAAASPPS